ncbi:methylmalonyl Co-A mutase-associated GTPase MeaB [Pelagicoccus sp. SDUM812002]|uniref:methylmalonyl Co-A mutase-associated GTPase MeaB n=1 Tax=Pelagicoccus sp. SDUM812002 TaxID=3041266 RepID=UPI00280F1445|nr:methylmalonyl Co-A mutase-associated GTPase MeaB [Pelagicoccus sp. SDUM812002]MDQ8184411.1 methylmalonyl Co-A mutase-associated GTPase MeaB [Pelagicoccus sp. SDUM812002]
MSEKGKTRSPEWHPSDADKTKFAGEVMAGKVEASPPIKVVRRPRRRPLDADELYEGILAGNRTALARGITCVESEAPRHQEIARELLRRCLPHSGNSVRIGITGIPGAGKSQFLECMGKMLCEADHPVAVLAVDPSSSVTGGSILGDKTRMENLCRDVRAFIRPSPAGKTLGGVAAKTRESVILCEAAGYKVIFVETVGVGQSEIAVRSMVDFFLLLQLAGAGDELQGIKKGVIEMADAIVVNKSDGDNVRRTKVACGEYARVLHHLHPFTEGWEPKALCCSGLEGTGVWEIWEMVQEFCQTLKAEKRFDEIRAKQNAKWFRSLLEQRVLEAFYREQGLSSSFAELEIDVSAGRIPVIEAVEKIMEVSC